MLICSYMYFDRMAPCQAKVPQPPNAPRARAYGRFNNVRSLFRIQSLFRTVWT